MLASGAAGSLFAPRAAGWEHLDPQRLSASLGSIGNALAASALRWDAIGYLRVAAHGYTSTRSTVLFPLYPLLIRVGGAAVGSPVVAGMLISLAAFTIGMFLVHRIAAEEVGSRSADASVLLLAFSPFSFVFSAVYTASLLLAFSGAAFYLARRGRFVAACMLAAAAALTHVQGILLALPLAFMYWNSRGRTRELRRLWSPDVLALTLPPLALGGLFLYMHSQGWGWFAQIANQNAADAGRSLVGTPLALIRSVQDAVLGLNQSLHGVGTAAGVFPLGLQNIIYLIGFTVAVLSLVSAWKRLPRQYVLFAALAILICSSSAVAMEPLKGFDRYMLPIFPLWIGAAAWLREHRLMPATLIPSTMLLVFYTIEFTRWISVF